MKLTRRESLGVLGFGGVMLNGVAHARSQASPGAGAQASASPAFAGKHEIVPLPFEPKSLKGLSEKLIVSHHDNNYAGAVKSLNKVEGELSRVTADTPAFVVGGLKQSELQFKNSMVLHEHYFANLGGTGKPGGALESQLTSTYGSLARWEEMFRATGASLGGGSGWAVLAFDLTRGSVHTYWSGHHTQSHAASVPLLVMDMYEHAYQMDYGAGAAKYIDAFFTNVNWEQVEQRLARATKAWQALKS